MMTRKFMTCMLTILLLPAAPVWSQADNNNGHVEGVADPAGHHLFEYVPEDAVGLIVLQTPASLDKSLMDATQGLPEQERLPEESHPSMDILGSAFLADTHAIDRHSPVIMVLVHAAQTPGQQRPLLPYHMMLIAKAADGVTKAPTAGQPDRLIMPTPTVHMVDGLIIVTNSSKSPTKPANISKLTTLLPDGQIRMALEFADLWKNYGDLFGMSAMQLLAADRGNEPDYQGMAITQSLSDHAKNITNLGCGLQIGATTDITMKVWTDIRETGEGPDRKLAMMASRLRHGTIMVSADQALLDWGKDLLIVAAEHAEQANATPQAKAALVRLGKLSKTLAAEGQTGRVLSVELYEKAMGIHGLAGTSDPAKYLASLREMFGLLAEMPGMNMNMNMKVEPGDTLQLQLKTRPNMQPAMVHWLEKYGTLQGTMSAAGDDMVSIELKSGELPGMQITQLNQLANLLGEAKSEVRLAWAVDVGALVRWAFGVLDGNAELDVAAGQNSWMLGTLERHPVMWQMEMRIPVDHILEAAMKARANRAPSISAPDQEDSRSTELSPQSNQENEQKVIGADRAQSDLLKAVDNCDEQKIEQALASGASANTHDEAGATPLMIASNRGCTVAIPLLLAHGADVNAVDHEGMTAIAWAINRDEGASIEALAAGGANLNLCMGVDPKLTPLGLAAMKNRDVAAASLIKAGSKLNGRCDDGPTPLQLGTLHGNLRLITVLVRGGADVHASSKNLAPALVLAAKRGKDKRMITFLLAKGADVNATGPDGKTALIEAATRGDLLQVKDLLAYGADPSIKDNAGNTAMIAAENKGWGATSPVKLRHEKVMSALKEALEKQASVQGQ